MKTKFYEISEEFKAIVVWRGNAIDGILPFTGFLILNPLTNLDTASFGALAISIIISSYRLIKRQSLKYSLGGLGGIVIAIGVAKLFGQARGYFLPGILTGAITIVACIISIVSRRPLVAWTSHFVRRWPLNWYWHPNIRPAYTEVTIIWVGYFTFRLLLQLTLYQRGDISGLGTLQLISGWPATVFLLVTSYLYGTWRLKKLKGPSIVEFKENTPQPWEGQHRGF